jgi:hypothetical protein
MNGESGGFGGRRWVTGVDGGAGDPPSSPYRSGADPVPTALLDRVRFALDPLFDAEPGTVDLLRHAGGRRLSLRRGRVVVLRGTSGGDVTVVLVARPCADGFRLVGRLAPAGPGTVTLRTACGPLLATCDGRGRFALAPVPPGLTQLVLRRPAGRPLVGPAVQF